MGPQTHITVIISIIVALTITLWVSVAGVIYLVVIKSDPALVAIVAGFAGTSLGVLGGMLNSTASGRSLDSTKLTDPSKVI